MCSSFPNGPLRIVQNTSPDVSNQSVSKYLKSKRACAIGLLHHPWGGRRITRAPLAQYIVTHFKYLGHSKISSNIRIRLLKLVLPDPPSVRKNEKGFWRGLANEERGVGARDFPSLSPVPHRIFSQKPAFAVFYTIWQPGKATFNYINLKSLNNKLLRWQKVLLSHTKTLDESASVHTYQTLIFCPLKCLCISIKSILLGVREEFFKGAFVIGLVRRPEVSHSSIDARSYV